MSKRTRESLFSTRYGYGECKDPPRRTTSDKVLHDKEFPIANNVACMMDSNKKSLQQFSKFWTNNLKALLLTKE